ncbi:MAG: serine/threonine-protein kinase, partial [Acidobacteriota bacterium]
MKDHWRTIRGIFEDLLDLEEPERPAFLDEACGDNAELRREVDSLLAADQMTRGLIASMLPKIQRPKEVRVSFEGQTLGDYHLGEKIGEGGSSVVYRASVLGESGGAPVAIKIQSRSLAGDSQRERFRRERRILAKLEHPDIVRLIEGGSTEDGALYVVMEYVEGLPIDAYCDLHRLTIEERLELFARVCRAVHFAHQNLVLHRDLKPSNILIDVHGAPHLLDFGIAKLLEPEPGDGSAEATASWLRMMTPNFASPEQARGESLTTASDVYSLGVLLYRLLCGQPPYRLDNLEIREIEKRLSHSSPPLPSRSVSPATPQPETEEYRQYLEIAALRRLQPRSLEKELTGDLDAVVQRAMHGEPAKRYESPAALAEDLERFVAGRPVLASKNRVPYRLSRALTHHRRALIAIAAVLITALSFSAVLFQKTRALEAEIAADLLRRDELAERWRFYHSHPPLTPEEELESMTQDLEMTERFLASTDLPRSMRATILSAQARLMIRAGDPER